MEEKPSPTTYINIAILPAHPALTAEKTRIKIPGISIHLSLVQRFASRQIPKILHYCGTWSEDLLEPNRWAKAARE